MTSSASSYCHTPRYGRRRIPTRCCWSFCNAPTRPRPTPRAGTVPPWSALREPRRAQRTRVDGLRVRGARVGGTRPRTSPALPRRTAAGGQSHEVGVQVDLELGAAGAAVLVRVPFPGLAADLVGKPTLHEQQELERGAFDALAKLDVVPVLA